VDEMQDSKGGQLRMLQVMTKSATCLAAADEYQDLEADGKNEAVCWARENGDVVSLQQIHRTDVQGLLDAARAIRQGQPVTNGKGFEIVCVPKFSLGAWYVSNHITKWKREGNIVILTPTGPDNSAFVRSLINRVESGPFNKPYIFGPHNVPWETSIKATFIKFIDSLKLPDDPTQKIDADQLVFDTTNGVSTALVRWIDRQRKIAAKTKFSVSEIHAQVSSIQQRLRAFGYSWDRRVGAMTVHQAKNREFDFVIILWPFEIQGSDERHRRLLYNAVTRARNKALVVVHDPYKNRIKHPPFVPAN